MTGIEKRCKFTGEYKVEVVGCVIETGGPVRDIADELGLVPQMLGMWVQAY